MARAIEKAIKKNQQKLYKNQPKKQKSKKPDPTDWVYYYGKSYLFPIFLFIIAVFSAFTISSQKDANLFYYFTVAAYFGLSIFYFIKKPYLRVGKDFISTRRLGSDKAMDAEKIKLIEVYDGYILISFHKRRNKWVFSKSINRYPIEQMAIALEKFAKSNRIEYIQEGK